MNRYKESIEQSIRQYINIIDTATSNAIEQIDIIDDEENLTLLDTLNELQNSITEWQELKKYI